MKTLIDNCLDHVFDTLELYSYKQVFGITTRQASNMVLPHHAGLDLRRGEGDDHERESRELEDRQRELTRKLNAVSCLWPGRVSSMSTWGSEADRGTSTCPSLPLRPSLHHTPSI